MDGHGVHVTMAKMVTGTIIYAMGIGMALGSAIAGVVAILQ